MFMKDNNQNLFDNLANIYIQLLLLKSSVV